MEAWDITIDTEEGIVICDGIVCGHYDDSEKQCSLCPMKGIKFDPEDELSEELYNHMY